MDWLGRHTGRGDELSRIECQLLELDPFAKPPQWRAVLRNRSFMGLAHARISDTSLPPDRHPPDCTLCLAAVQQTAETQVRSNTRLALCHRLDFEFGATLCCDNAIRKSFRARGCPPFNSPFSFVIHRIAVADVLLHVTFPLSILPRWHRISTEPAMRSRGSP